MPSRWAEIPASRITVSVPYWHAAGTVRRTVESVLAQTWRDLTVVVINDGDDVRQLHAALRGIRDDRLVVHSLPANHGMYFATAVVLGGTGDRLWSQVDADDWIEPHRLEKLAAGLGDADAVFTPWTNHNLDGTTHIRGIQTPEYQAEQGWTLRAVAHMCNLWTTGFARQIVHPGCRLAWDQMMTQLAWRFGTITVVDDPSHHRQMTAGSLMASARTGRGSPARRRDRRHHTRLWPQLTACADVAQASRLLRRDSGRPVVNELKAEVWRMRQALA
jgi:hypothetical protein